MRNILYWHCPKCTRHVPLQRVLDTDTLTGNCCGKVWHMLPRYDYSKYFVASHPVDMGNVRVMIALDV